MISISLGLLLILAAQPMILHTVVFPSAGQGENGWMVQQFLGRHGQGKRISEGRQNQERLLADRPESTLAAWGVITARVSGLHRIQLICDDFGRVEIDGVTLIRPAGHLGPE